MNETVVKWIGGKNDDIGSFIISKMKPHKHYREVFMGSGTIFFQKEIAKTNVLNDLNFNLVTLWKVIMHEEKRKDLEALLSFCAWDRNLFNYILQCYQDFHFAAKHDDTMRAFMFLYLNRTSFNGMFDSYARREDSAVLYKLHPTIKLAYQKLQLASAVIENLHFAEFLLDEKNKRRYDEKDYLIYLDPPYWVTTEVKYYEKQMTKTEHRQLRDILVSHEKANWLLSYDYVDEVLDLYNINKDAKTLLENDKEVISSFPDNERNVYAILTPSYYQSSSGKEDVYKRELLIANYSLKDEGTLFE